TSSSCEVDCRPATTRSPAFRPLVSASAKLASFSSEANSSMNSHKRRLGSSGSDRMDVQTTSTHAEISGRNAGPMSSRHVMNKLPPSGFSNQLRMLKSPSGMVTCSGNLSESTKRAEVNALLASFDPADNDSANVPSKKARRSSNVAMGVQWNQSRIG